MPHARSSDIDALAECLVETTQRRPPTLLMRRLETRNPRSGVAVFSR
jgi:hypothetical protein